MHRSPVFVTDSADSVSSRKNYKEGEVVKSVNEIVESIDLYDPEQRPHMLDALRAAREGGCPFPRAAGDGEYYVATRYEDVKAIAERPDKFSSCEPALRGLPVSLAPLDLDPPIHRDFRKFLNKYFSRNYLLKYEDQIRQVGQDLVAKVARKLEEHGEFEFVHDFAIPFTAGALGRVVFATEDADLTKRAVSAVERAATEGTPEAFFEIALIAGELLEEVEKNPESRDDVLGALVTATVEDGRLLTDDERLGVVTALLAGGLDTTRSAMSNIAYHLATNPEVEGRLRNPDWWKVDLDEFLRFEPTVSFMARTVTEDTTIGDCEFKKGDRIAVNYMSANRDVEHFDNPDELDFERMGTPHVAFGVGVHRCLGSHFARIQLAIAYEELLSKFENFRLTIPKEETPRQVGISYNSVESVPITCSTRNVVNDGIQETV
ncbi:cytochrome P450 [Rhodococcus sp. A14]|nr:cytochrome P450 [Rhodococcus sp. A14]QSE87128.1 cytochrome P450 [Rhodococcus koreensis]RZK75022.1 MAG: cytochrome P450 [Rhodococcus sp. (in: high G+C Gram-positive bacteria)]